MWKTIPISRQLCYVQSSSGSRHHLDFLHNGVCDRLSRIPAKKGSKRALHAVQYRASSWSLDQSRTRAEKDAAVPSSLAFVP